MPAYAGVRLSREPMLLNVFSPHLLNVLRKVARFRKAVITQSFQPARAPGERIDLTQITLTRIKARREIGTNNASSCIPCRQSSQ